MKYNYYNYYIFPEWQHWACFPGLVFACPVLASTRWMQSGLPVDRSLFLKTIRVWLKPRNVGDFLQTEFWIAVMSVSGSHQVDRAGPCSELLPDLDATSQWGRDRKEETLWEGTTSFVFVWADHRPKWAEPIIMSSLSNPMTSWQNLLHFLSTCVLPPKFPTTSSFIQSPLLPFCGLWVTSRWAL